MFLLEPVGFGRSENAVYLALLDVNRATAAAVADHVGMPVDQVQDALARLANAGLANQVGFRPAVYAAVAPDAARGALIQRRRADLTRLQTHAAELAARLRETDAEPEGAVVSVVRGTAAVTATLDRLRSDARKELLGVEAPPSVGGPADPEPPDPPDGVECRVIYGPEALRSPQHVESVRRRVEAGEQARVLSDASLTMLVADRATALIPASHNRPDVRLLVRGSALIDILVAWFESMWARARPVGVDAESDLVSPRDRRMLTLLAAGLKDRSIARALGITERTVGRRLTELMTALDAETRFQAGVRAAHRGWL